MTTVEGTCTPRFAPLRDLFEQRLADGEELGASVCVIVDGEPVADLWGGIADQESGRPWERDTLVNTFSLTKTMVALVVHKLIDTGVLDPDAPVARYWPEFGAAGKEGVLLRHVLSHTSGVPGWANPVTLDDVYDTERAAAMLAEQEPWWTPGDGSGYQTTNHGHLLGEVVRRATGSTLGTLLRKEFAEPAGADYWLGAPASVDERVASLVAAPGARIDYSALSEIAINSLANPPISPAVTTSREFLAAELGAFNGQGNARSVATLQAIVSHGGEFGGNRYLSADAVERILEAQSDGTDRVLGAPLRFGLGYALPSPGTEPALPDGRICWWTGFGGSIVVNDLDRRMTIAYTMNRLHTVLVNAPNATAWIDAAYACH